MISQFRKDVGIGGNSFDCSKFEEYFYLFIFIFFLFIFFKFYFIFKLYIIVLVLPNIEMNPPQVYMCSPSWTLLPPHTIPLGRPSVLAPRIQYHALNLDWHLVSYMIFYMFQCHTFNTWIENFGFYRHGQIFKLQNSKLSWQNWKL